MLFRYINNMLDKIISKIKGDSNYKIESKYSNIEIAKIIFHRAIPLMRGMLSVFSLKNNGLFFRGKNVTIKHAQLINSGKNLILGDYVLLDALSENGIKIGDNVTIERNTIINCTGVISNKGVGVEIGDNTGINTNVYIGGQGGVRIGSNVIIGPYVKIFSENHIFGKRDTIIKEQGESRLGVIIEDNCWIGSGATILDGVRIKSNSIIASGAVVTKNFEGNCVIGGVPAKLIKHI